MGAPGLGSAVEAAHPEGPDAAKRVLADWRSWVTVALGVVAGVGALFAWRWSNHAWEGARSLLAPAAVFLLFGLAAPRRKLAVACTVGLGMIAAGFAGYQVYQDTHPCGGPECGESGLLVTVVVIATALAVCAVLLGGGLRRGLQRVARRP